MTFAIRPALEWTLRTRTLALGARTLVMGVLNVTPDSFSDGGQFFSPERAVAHALRMLDEGADILDLGGESTRPGDRAPVSAQQEQDRILPVMEAVLRARPGTIVSIDTYKAATARAAIFAGAEIVNDVSGFLWDQEMAAACAELACGVVLMHTRGRPNEWRSLPPIPAKDAAAVVREDLAKRIRAARKAGIAEERIVIDPGFGFGKAFDANYPLLAQLSELQSLGLPILAGVSRKSFLSRTLAPLRGGAEIPPEQRVNATIAASTACILAGSHIVRVHDVRPMAEAAAIADAILANS